jgi:hypothetical protein
MVYELHRWARFSAEKFFVTTTCFGAHPAYSPVAAVDSFRGVIWLDLKNKKLKMPKILFPQEHLGL